MKQKVKIVFSVLMCFTILSTLFAASVQATTTTITSNQTGIHEGYYYEYWKDSGNGTMTLNSSAFSCEWDNINKIAFRKGFKTKNPKFYNTLGYISMNYSCIYQPNGDSILAVHGWLIDPLVEFYIVESYGILKPVQNIALNFTYSIDGATYEFYETTATRQTSQNKTETYKQYWSIRTQKRTKGTISISEHFKAWNAKDMIVSEVAEVCLSVEGNKSSGKADVNSMELWGLPSSDYDTPTPYVTPPYILYGDVNQDNKVNALDLAYYRMYLLGTIDFLPAEGDIDQNGDMNSIDFALLRKLLLGILVIDS